MKKNLLSNLLNQKSIKSLFKVFDKKSQEISLVGGCVRDAYFNKISKDIDVAANIIPDEILTILNKNNIKYDDYAYNYGSITAFIEDQTFQITSLREDINPIGRHTDIIFTNNWKKDSARRDFTINSIYLSCNGQLTDFFNGKEDLMNNTLRFLGEIEKSIQQDYLRIFRYYRFLGVFENPNLISEYDDSLSQHIEKSFNFLSNDLIRQEILKMFKSSFPMNCFFDKKNTSKKKYWIESVKEHFTKTGYDIGLNKCLNKIDLLFN
mgnify:CR=1 FL=1|tara:strand:- start:111 stop:905 length:795 start_codon:yes stop_codon:yes gene_type:complete